MRRKFFSALFIVAAFLAFAAPSWANTHIEKTLALSPEGRFVLETDGGSITVYGTSESGAKIVITSERNDLQDLFDFSFEANPGVVRVRGERRSFWSWFSTLNLHYDVRVPKNTILQIKTGGGPIEVDSIGRDAELKTSGGPITVNGVAGRLLARTSGGGIRVTQIDGNADLETSGGPIEATFINGALVAHTSGGSIHVDQIAGRIDAHTSGGGITAVLSRNNSHGGTISSSGGSVSVAIDPAANLQIDASTSGGSVRSDLPIHMSGDFSRHSIEGSLGSGGSTLSVHTSGGSVHILAL